MDRIQLKEYAKAKVSGKRVILWKGLIFLFLGNMVASFFTVWFEPVFPEYFYSVEEILYYTRGLAITTLITMFLTTPLTYGVNQYMMDFDKDEFVNNNVLFTPYRHIIKIFVLSLFIGFVCSLPMIVLCLLSFFSINILPFALFIGAILNFYLSLYFVAVPYIFNDHKDKSIIEIMKISASIMNGYKMDYFILSLSFLGWAILSLLTCGILYIWVEPYASFTFAKFFLNIKEAYYYVKEDDTNTNEDTFTIG